MIVRRAQMSLSGGWI